MRQSVLMLLLGLVVLLAGASLAHAGATDLTLWRFCVRNDGTTGDGYCQADPSRDAYVLADGKKFRSFVKGFSALMAPRFMAPAGSLGWAGWHIGAEYSASMIPGGKAWDDALEGVERVKKAREAFPSGSKDAKAPGVLNTLQLHVRKGLPFSAELGATATYLIQSKMVVVGFEGKYAVLDGYKNAPDIALRMNYQHLFGSPDLDLDMLGWDLNLSYDFGVGGFMKIAPYTGYSIVYSMARPHVVNASFSSENTGRLLRLKDTNVVLHRWFFGARLLTNYVSLTPEFIVTSAKVHQISLNLGSEF